MNKSKAVKKSKHGPISQKAVLLRADPESVDAIEAYQEYMRSQHHVEITANKAINALIQNGMQYIRDAQQEAQA